MRAFVPASYVYSYLHTRFARNCGHASHLSEGNVRPHTAVVPLLVNRLFASEDALRVPHEGEHSGKLVVPSLRCNLVHVAPVYG